MEGDIQPRRGLGRVRVALRPARRAWRSSRVRERLSKLPPVRRLTWRRELSALRRSPTLTFNQKVRYKMLADRRPLVTVFSDKAAAHAYVEARVGASYVPAVYALTEDAKTLSRDELPRQFVVKATHGSGGVVVVADFAPPDATLPGVPADGVVGPGRGWGSALVHPDSLEWDRLVETGAHWLTLRYGRSRGEWGYRNVTPRILVEELIGSGAVPPDYKLYVFHGHVRLISVELDRFTFHTRSIYTPAWERLPVAWTYPHGVDVEPPPALAEMIDVAERLGAETDFVRVDLYCDRGRVVFGELTNYPDAGYGTFEPPEFDLELGEWWTLPRRYE